MDKEDKALWNEYVQRYHYLGYKKPFGYRQRYFIEAGAHRLGCILLSGPAKALTARDRWIGWDDRQRLEEPALGAQQQPVPPLSLGPGGEPGQPRTRATGPAGGR